MVRAKRWAHGWELHIDDVGVTQSHTLRDAAAIGQAVLEAAERRERAVDLRRAVLRMDLGLRTASTSLTNCPRLAKMSADDPPRLGRGLAVDMQGD